MKAVPSAGLDGRSGQCGRRRQGSHAEVLKDFPEGVTFVRGLEGMNKSTWSRSRCICQDAFRITSDREKKYYLKQRQFKLQCWLI